MFAHVADSGGDVAKRLKHIFKNAQGADQTGLAKSVRAMNSLAAAQVRKDTPSLIDVKGLGWAKDFTAGFEENGSVLCWRDAEQATEISVVHVELKFTPATTNVERSVLGLEFGLAADAGSSYGFHEAMRPMTWSPTRGRTCWKPGEDCRNDMIQMTGG